MCVTSSPIYQIYIFIYIYIYIYITRIYIITELRRRPCLYLEMIYTVYKIYSVVD